MMSMLVAFYVLQELYSLPCFSALLKHLLTVLEVCFTLFWYTSVHVTRSDTLHVDGQHAE